MRVTRTCASAVALALLLGSLALGADVYIAQTTQGGDTGADCADAHSAAWFNANATGGNTYHLCGTFTGTAGSTMLTPPNSGSSGNILGILFETNAVLTAPYWGGASAGAINISSKGYITIDGGSNGIIQNTANGTSLAYRQASQGIYVTASNNITIQNLTIQNIYVNEGSSPGATDTDGAGTNNVYVVGQSSNISIHDNVLTAARAGIRVDLAGSLSGLYLYGNTISDHCWGIMVGEGSGGFSGTDVLIYSNTITNWTNWQYPSAAYHTDGVITYVRSGSTLAPRIYGNYIYGDLGTGSPTAFIFCTYGTTAPGVTCAIYNNLLVTSGHNLQAIWLKDGQTGNEVYNNTIVGFSSSSGIAVQLETSTTTMTYKNNILTGYLRALASYNDLAAQVTASNNNVFYEVSANPFSYNDGGGYYTYAQWQALGFDADSSTGNPNLDSSYKLQAGSSAIGLGTNLTGLCSTYPALCSDKSGVARPATGAWDAGAYQFSATNRPNPPVALRVTSVK